MLSICGRGARLCDGLSRREILRVGGLGLFGVGLDSLLEGRRALSAARDALPANDRPGRAKSCIVLFAMGGPPQHSTWDPKPDAPVEVRGEFGPIPTVAAGVSVCELFPLVAQQMDKIALLRGVSTGDNAHSSSGYAMLTGQPHQPLNVENANPGAPNNWPTLGAVVQHLRPAGELPTAIRLPHHIFNTDQSVWPGQDSGFLGPKSNPWLVRCQPASPSAPIAQLHLPDELTTGRLEGRRGLLRQIDSLRRETETSSVVDNFLGQHARAFHMLASPQAREAFDLSAESDAVRDRYGRGQFGQSVLLARRLVERGVGLVQVNWFRSADEPSDAPCWDSHARESSRLKTVLAPPLDQAFSALVAELAARGLLDETLVVCMGEFGRTPRFNPAGGRDHWGSVFSVALAGGGVRGGVVYGASDKLGAYVKDGLVQPADLATTIYHCLGIPAETQIRDLLDRPLSVAKGRVIREVLA